MLAFFGRILGKKQPEEQVDPMKKFLIVGLGNIGPKYHHTRHNIGFKILDHIAEKKISPSAQKNLEMWRLLDLKAALLYCLSLQPI
jgi:peptidyl-tRNA hydrolase, PTH1 family